MDRVFRVLAALFAVYVTYGGSLPLAYAGNGIFAGKWPDLHFGPKQSPAYKTANDIVDGKTPSFKNAAKGWDTAESECSSACKEYPLLNSDVENVFKKAEKAKSGLSQASSCPAAGSILAQLKIPDGLTKVLTYYKPIQDNFKAADSHQLLGGTAAIKKENLVLPSSHLDGAGREEELVSNAKRVAQNLEQAGLAISSRPEKPCQSAGKALKSDGEALQKVTANLEKAMAQVRDGAAHCAFAWQKGRITEGLAAGRPVGSAQAPDLSYVADAGSYACTAKGYSNGRGQVVAKSSEALKNAVKPTNEANQRALADDSRPGVPKGKTVAEGKFGWYDGNADPYIKYGEDSAIRGVSAKTLTEKMIVLNGGGETARQLGVKPGDPLWVQNVDTGQVAKGYYVDNRGYGHRDTIQTEISHDIGRQIGLRDNNDYYSKYDDGGGKHVRILTSPPR